MRTTYILGAGASKAIWGFPVMKGFLAACQNELNGPGTEALKDYLSQRFGDLPQLDLEDVLTDLDNSLSGLGGIWHGQEQGARLDARQVHAQLIGVIRQRLTIPDAMPDTALAGYGRILEGFGELDSVITFNYDGGIEAYARSPAGNAQNVLHLKARVFGTTPRFLADLHPYGPAYGEQPYGWSSHFLKLHGSLDYLACGNAVCPMRAAIYAPEEVPRSPSALEICPVCGADMETVIVPPTLMKSFDQYPKLSLFWRVALKVLRASERLVVWGFSCPTSDHHVSWLLRSCRHGNAATNALKEVVIIDPNCDEVEKRLRSLLGTANQVTWRLLKEHEAYRLTGE